MSNLNKYFVFLNLLLIGFSFCLSAEAQRRSKKPSQDIIKKSEYYFTEAEKYFILEDYAKSIALFKKSLEINPDNAAAYYKISEINLKNDHLQDALENAVKSLELEKYKYTYLLLADIYNQMGDLESSAETYEELINTIPGTEKHLFDLAAIYLYQDEHEKALSTYNEIENIYGINEEIAFQKQRIYNRLGREDDARAEFEKLIDRFPDNEYYAVSYAEFLLNIDERDEAINMLTEFTGEYPESPRVALLLGEIYRNNDNLQKAEEYLLKGFLNNEIDINQKVTLIASYKAQLPDKQLESLIDVLCSNLTTFFPEEPFAHAVYGDFLYETGKIAKAKEYYLNSLNEDPDNFSVWQNLLLIETELAHYDDVLEHTEEALVLYPNQGILYYLNGFALLRKKQYYESVFILQQGLRMTGTDKKVKSDFFSLLGEAYNGLKQYGKSDQAYDSVLAYQPNNYMVLNNYSYYLALRNEKLDLAEKMSSKLVKNNPENATFLDTHAWVLFTQKKYKEAKKIIEKAIKTGNASAVHFEHYGDILFKLGDVNKAVSEWQKAKGMDSTLYMIDKKIADKKLYEK